MLSNFVMSVCVSIYGLFSTLYHSIISIWLGPIRQKERGDVAVRNWAIGILKVAQIPWQVTGLENVPATGGCLFVINHTSLLDIPLVHAAVPPFFRFGAKAELFKIPIFGWAMRRGGALEIERQNRAAVMKVYDKAAVRLAAGERFVLAPESTRQHEEKLGEFKSGPFILAIKAQVPIVPVVLSGIASALPKSGFLIRYRGTPMARVQILPSISTQGITVDDRDVLRKQTFEKMKLALETK